MNALPIFFSGFVATLVCWLALVSYCVLDRRRHESLMRCLRDCPANDGLSADTVFTTLSRRRRYALVVDPAQPDWLKERLAAFMLARYGEQHMARQAASAGRRRIAALHVLYRSGSPKMHELLRTALFEGDPAVAAVAVVLLGKLRSRRAAAILIEALRNNWYTPSYIAVQLDQFDAPLLADRLTALLDEREPRLRYWAISLLLRHRALAQLDVLLAAHANDPDPSVRKVVAQAMGAIGGAVAAAVAMGMLDDPVPFVRAHAVRALGSIALHDGTTAGRQVAPMLADRDWWVRLAAREALVAMGAGVRQEVAAQLASDDAFARDGARDVLRQTGRMHAGDAPAASAGVADGVLAAGGMTS